MIVEVMLYGQILGIAEWNDQKGFSTFQYSDKIINTIEPSPLIMPTEERIFETNRDHIHFHNLPYLLSDSMPDDFCHVMMKEWLKQRKLSIDDINPVDRLTYVGKISQTSWYRNRRKYFACFSLKLSEILFVASPIISICLMQAS